MTIAQYAVRCERQIARVVTAEGLHVVQRGVVQGPLTLTYRLQLRQASPANLRRLLGLEMALGVALGAPVRMAVNGFAIDVEVGLPAGAWRTPRARELAQYGGGGLTVCVGLDSLRRPALVNLAEHGALLWVGPSGRGKTQSMQATVYQLCQRGPVQFFVLTFKADWQAFAQVPGCLGLVRTGAESLQALRWTIANMRSEDDEPVIVVVDDLLNLLAALPGLGDPLGEIASLGRAARTHLLIGTQEAGSRRGTGGGGVEANATARILYRATSAAAAARAAGAGDSGVDSLSAARGDALLLVDGEQRRIATGYMAGETLTVGGGWTPRRAPWAVVADRQAQPRATGHNQGQPVVAPPTFSPDVSDVGGDVGGVVVVAEDDTALLAGFPIGKRALTAEEAARVRQLASRGYSLNRLTQLVYTHKDGQRFGWIKAAVAPVTAAAAAEQP